jgi:hypothetical protein
MTGLFAQSPVVDGAKAGLGWAIGQILGAGADASMAPINAAASAIADAAGTVFATLATLWIRLSVPNVWNGSTGPAVQALQNELAPLVALLAVLGIIIGACRLAWEQHSKPGEDIVHGLIVLVLVTGIGVPTIGLLTSGSDAWANSIINDATEQLGGDFAHNLTSLTPLGHTPVAPVLVMLFGIVALFLSIAQIMLLAFRAAALVLIAGVLPVSAAMTTTTAGQQHFKKLVAWVLALTVYKPLAALIYATAFRLASTPMDSGAGVGAALIGLTMMLLAVLALPALLRLLVPAIGALAATPKAGTGALPKGAKTAVKAL